jgi:hypothetical protein
MLLVGKVKLGDPYHLNPNIEGTRGKVIALGWKKHTSGWYLEIDDYRAKTKVSGESR